MNYPHVLLAAIAGLIVFLAWGFRTEGWLIGKDFARSSGLHRASDLQMKYMPLGMASVLIALVLYAAWCGGTSGAMKRLQFGLLMSVFTACSLPISNLVTMNMDLQLGLEVTATTFVGWLLAGFVIGLVYKAIAP